MGDNCHHGHESRNPFAVEVETSRTITAVEKGASPYGTRWGRRAQTLHQVDIGVNPLPTLRGGRARTPGVADIVVYPLPS